MYHASFAPATGAGRMTNRPGIDGRNRCTVRVFALALLLVGLQAACVRRDVLGEARSLAWQGDEAGAIATLREHLASKPGDREARKVLIRLLGESRDLDAAKREAGLLASQLEPGDPTAWIELGAAFELAHEFERALAAYDEARDRAPQSPLGPRMGGMRAARWGELEIASERLELALRRGAKDARFFHALGVVRLKRGELEGAEWAYERGIAADPDHVANVLGLATLAALRGKPDVALKWYTELAERRPRSRGAWLGQAWALFELGRIDEAEARLGRARALGASRQVIDRMRAAWRARQRTKPANAPNQGSATPRAEGL